MTIIKIKQNGTRISKLAFLSRLTDSEYIAIDLASIDDPTATIESRTNSAAIRRYMDKVRSAVYIDLSRDDIIAGLHALSLLGFLTAPREDAIRNDEITEDERYKGVE